MLRDLLTSFGQWLRTPDRRGNLRRMLDEWAFRHSVHPPEDFLCDVFPKLAGEMVPILINVSHKFELPYGERLFIECAVRSLQPRTIFEFGTYTGATTVAIARSIPEGGVVHTLDLPEEEIIWGEEVKRAIGREIQMATDVRQRIVQHRCNSHVFDYSAFRMKCDLIYIDGSHKYEDVLSDSHRALEMLAPGGMIIWDDYQTDTSGVWRALRQLSLDIPLRRVSQTRLAYFRS